jgi:predicted Zn-ribbon and HTH transcriptional regulator
MAATTTRAAARERLQKHFMDWMNQAIPEDEAIPMRGETFQDFENQAGELKSAIVPTVLEELAALNKAARAEKPGRCPHCGSEKTRFIRESGSTEMRAPDGILVLTMQRARCRSCDRSFSPSEP